jgi:hypothetical protein
LPLLRPLELPLSGITATGFGFAVEFDLIIVFAGADFLSTTLVFTGVPTKSAVVFLSVIKMMKITIT